MNWRPSSGPIDCTCYSKFNNNSGRFDALIIRGGFLHIFQIATMSLYEFESQFVYAINDRIKDFFSEEVLRAFPLESMWRFVFAVPPRKRIASQCTLGEFLRGDTILGGGAGRRIMGTQGLTCGGGYQSRHNCEMDSRRSEIPKCSP